MTLLYYLLVATVLFLGVLRATAQDRLGVELAELLDPTNLAGFAAFGGAGLLLDAFGEVSDPYVEVAVAAFVGVTVAVTVGFARWTRQDLGRRTAQASGNRRGVDDAVDGPPATTPAATSAGLPPRSASPDPSASPEPGANDPFDHWYALPFVIVSILIEESAVRWRQWRGGTSPVAAPAIQASPIGVGTLAVAECSTAICRAGEVGVCYEVYEVGGRPGYSFLFQGGGHDGFSPSDVEALLDVQPVCDRAASSYEFTNVGRLRQDYNRGRFRSALGA